MQWKQLPSRVFTASGSVTEREMSEAVLQFRYRRIRLHPPTGKRKLHPDPDVTIFHTLRSRIRQRITTGSTESLSPTFLFTRGRTLSRSCAGTRCAGILRRSTRSSNRASRPNRSYRERLVNRIALLCILSWRIFSMTMVNRTITTAQPDTVFTKTELYLLHQLVRDKLGKSPSELTLTLYLIKLAQLGSPRGRAKDPPQGIPSSGKACQGSLRSS